MTTAEQMTEDLTVWARKKHDDEVRRYARAQDLVLQVVERDAWLGPDEIITRVFSLPEVREDTELSASLVFGAIYRLSDGGALDRNVHGEVRALS